MDFGYRTARSVCGRNCDIWIQGRIATYIHFRHSLFSISETNLTDTWNWILSRTFVHLYTALSYLGVVYLLYMLYFKLSCVYCCSCLVCIAVSCLVCTIVVVLCVLLLVVLCVLL